MVFDAPLVNKQSDLKEKGTNSLQNKELFIFSAVFVGSSVLLEYLKSKEEKTNDMLREFKNLKAKLENTLENCEYTNIHVSSSLVKIPHQCCYYTWQRFMAAEEEEAVMVP